MQRIKFGECEFEVDVEATKEYYRSFTVFEPDTQCNRNYQEYCKSLTEQEQSFFDSLGIDPKCCNVSTFGLSNNKSYPTLGTYFFAGKTIKKPKEKLTVEEFAEKFAGKEFTEEDFVADIPDPRIYIGKYRFDFTNPDLDPLGIPCDMPQDFIYVRFLCEEMPWLLKEKCEDQMYYSNKEWQLIKKSRVGIVRLSQHFDFVNALKKKLIHMFEWHKIGYKTMKMAEVEAYINRWFKEIVSINNQEHAHDKCFSTGGWRGYLWHAFSYEYVPCTDGDDARIEFNKCNRGKAVVLMEKEKIGFVLDISDGIMAEELEEFGDIYVTHENFDWTYVHTHEGDHCGPYFWSRGVDHIDEMR